MTGVVGTCASGKRQKRRDRKKGKKSNVMAMDWLREKTGMVVKDIFHTNERDADGYYVSVVKMTDTKNDPHNPFVVKTTNLKSDIEWEWEIISYLKEHMVNPSRLIREADLFEIEGSHKKALRMPYLVSFPELKEMPHYEDSVGMYIGQLMKELAEMHRCGVVHADIKGDNFMYDEMEDRMVFMDYGSALIIEDNLEKGMKGLDRYDPRRRIDIRTNHMEPSDFRPPECFEERELSEYTDWANSIAALEDEMKSDRSPVLKRKIKMLEADPPGCATLMESYNDDALIDAVYSFTYHNTIYADIYALAKCVMEDMADYLTTEYVDYLMEMASCDLRNRPTPDSVSVAADEIFGACGM